MPERKQAPSLSSCTIYAHQRYCLLLVCDTPTPLPASSWIFISSIKSPTYKACCSKVHPCYLSPSVPRVLLRVKQSRQNQAHTYKQMRQDNDRMWIKKNISFHTDSRNLAYQTSTPIIHEPSTISTTFLREQFYNCEIWFSIFKGLADIPWTCLTSPNMCDSRMSSIRHRCQVNQNPTPPPPSCTYFGVGIKQTSPWPPSTSVRLWLLLAGLYI